jgi:hypothetical protein
VDEPGNIALTPQKHPLFVRLRLAESTELGEQGMTPPRAEEPAEWRSLFGVCLAKDLDRRDRKLTVDEILRSSPRSDPSRVRESCSLPERLV